MESALQLSLQDLMNIANVLLLASGEYEYVIQIDKNKAMKEVRRMLLTRAWKMTEPLFLLKSSDRSWYSKDTEV